MTTIVGLSPGERGTAAVDLGAMTARSIHDDLVIAAIVPTPWPPDPHLADAEYIAFLEKTAEQALVRARTRVGSDLTVDCTIHRARSVSSGLLEVAHERNATLVALGSSASGVLGQVTLGGIADRILHSSDLPVTFAPRGFTAGPGARVLRVTVAFGRADHDSDLLATAASVAKRIGARLRVACFAVRPTSEYTGNLEVGAEALVVDEWVKGLHRDIARVLDSVVLDSLVGDSAVARVDTVVGRGGSWNEALADVSWAEGDVLAVGSSSSAISRFFLGSHASKIIRNAPVPVVLMPRSLVAR
jgi:nucleotide-binding universal stress UspA family protein